MLLFVSVPVMLYATAWHKSSHRCIANLLYCVTQDIERGAVDTQLIAHDREVYDIAWGGVGVFATVSADGSVRVFDLR